MSAHETVLSTLRSYRLPFGSELRMQDAIEQALQMSAVPYIRECRLTDADRIDFLVAGVGVECKIGGGPSTVLAQLLRYAEQPVVESLILVTSRNTHRFRVSTLNDKPFTVLWIAGQL